MHFLSERSAHELEAVSDLVLLDMCEGADGLEPTILIKTSSLNLKYLTRSPLELAVWSPEGTAPKYSLIVHDDEGDPLSLWSEIQVDEENEALNQVLNGKTCSAFLFNEWSMSVSWASLRVVSQPGTQSPGELLCPLTVTTPWINVPSHFYYRSSGEVVDLSDRDEGSQQEKLATWIVSRLGRGVSVETSPETIKGSRRKEVTDILVTWPDGALVVESKALSVLASSIVPNRDELRKRAGKGVDKAHRQLVGAVRTLRQERRIPTCTGPNGTPAAGGEVVHAAALVSDLSVLSRSQVPTTVQLKELVKTKGLMWHVLDPDELVRLIHASGLLQRP